ncbi:unnamed protein product [Nippostrongylus brasiliensis]|uniref:Uncharacterized protein n=1 Tax=Nippostrongylus brasiliensis TaxID=27835 RepID=A0A0N4Y8N3_NIPBR|nr:unnamed protein product [Nippostrongylus brasiliensis]
MDPVAAPSKGVDPHDFRVEKLIRYDLPISQQQSWGSNLWPHDDSTRHQPTGMMFEVAAAGGGGQHSQREALFSKLLPNALVFPQVESPPTHHSKQVIFTAFTQSEKKPIEPGQRP